MAHRGSTCPRDQGRAATWRLMIPHQVGTQDPSLIDAPSTWGPSSSRVHRYPGSKLCWHIEYLGTQFDRSRVDLGVKPDDGSRYQAVVTIKLFKPASAAWSRGPMGVQATRRAWKAR